MPCSEASTAIPVNADGHSHGFMPGGPFQAQQHREDQRVNRPHPHNHRRMAHRGVMQPQREAKLVHANAEKSQVKKRPRIAPQ